MKYSTLFILLIISCFTTDLNAQNAQKEVLKFQKKLNQDYRNPKKSPLEPAQLKTFKKHQFFPISDKFRIEAQFKKYENPATFKMKTSTDRQPTYSKYGEITFELENKTYKVIIYQNHELRAIPKYKNHLFLPFTDLTNGETTYEVGRYLDFEAPLTQKIILDFNKAYNPYCAYNEKYSCPIPPLENHLELRIEAGIKKPKK